MNIGSIKRNDRGTFTGRVSAMAFSLTIALREVSSTNPNAPKFEIFALSAAKEWVQVGAFFEMFSNRDGSAFLNGKIDDPSFEKPLYVTAFQQEDESYNIVWQRRTARPDVDRAMNRKGNDEMPPLPGEEAAQDDAGERGEGLGEGTAPNDFANPPARGGKGRKARETEGAEG
ncbi:uncharacterized protein (DUF736 family) [Sphingomonas zeicaulis]|uniref:DUF736 domain-containing protein n=1 Tax=Sphingomonas zeicaulis TaxID=1632740 RepID=UPI003D21EEC3